MMLKNPRHPGPIILQECIEALGLSIDEAAEQLGVPKKELSDVINCRAGVSVDLAIRLEKVFGSTADAWCRIQLAYDMAQAKKHAHKIKLKPAVAASLRPQPNI